MRPRLQENCPDIFFKLVLNGIFALLLKRGGRVVEGARHDYGEYISWPSRQAKDDNFAAIKDIHRLLH